MPDSPTPSSGGAGEPEPAGRERAADALRAAFARLAPQGSDAWNFLAAFTHLGDRYGPYHPGASALSDTLDATSRPSVDRLGRLGRSGRRRPWARPPARGGEGGAKSELEEAMGHVVEAFRFLSARVATLEERLAHQDRPVEGAAWLVPARELGAWTDPVATHLLERSPGGPIVHADCGEGGLLVALAAHGAVARGVEPRGAVALRALERGCTVTIGEGSEYLGAASPSSLGGVALSGVVDRVPVHHLLPVLHQCRRALARGAPLVVLSEPVTAAGDRPAFVRDLVEARPLHQSTWELLLTRTGFVDVRLLDGPEGPPDGSDGRCAVVAAVPW